MGNAAGAVNAHFTKEQAMNIKLNAMEQAFILAEFNRATPLPAPK
jgi:hypothetical protein